VHATFENELSIAVAENLGSIIVGALSARRRNCPFAMRSAQGRPLLPITSEAYKHVAMQTRSVPAAMAATIMIASTE